MKAKDAQKDGAQIDRDLPAANGLRAIFMWEGRKVPMVLERGLWRARCRRKGMRIDIGTGTPDLAMARKILKRLLEERQGQAAGESRAKGMMEAVAKVYRYLPKRTTDEVGNGNVQRLRSVVRLAWGKELAQVPVADFPRLWPAYVAARQGRAVPDYNTRVAGNRGINAAMRLARCVVLEKLWPAYAAQGIVMPPGAADVTWLPELHEVKPEARAGDLEQAWAALPVGDPLWWVVGLARYAGLRRSEILAMRGKWVLPRGAGVAVQLRDRPEDGYWTKTGRPYEAMVLHPVLAAALRDRLEREPDGPVLVHPEAERWIERAPQAWLRPFVGKVRLPLHRLRGLYADQVQVEMAEVIEARQAGVKAASRALGHTSVQTTLQAYLSLPGQVGDGTLTW